MCVNLVCITAQPAQQERAVQLVIPPNSEYLTQPRNNVTASNSTSPME